MSQSLFVRPHKVGEKLMKRFLKLGEPHGPSIRAGHANIHYHLDYIGFLMEKRTWLAGDDFSLADIDTNRIGTLMKAWCTGIV